MSMTTRFTTAVLIFVAHVACGGGDSGSSGGSGGGGGNGNENENDPPEVGCPSIACFPELTVELSPPLGVGSFGIDYTVDGADVSCTLELQDLGSFTCGGVAGAPCGGAAPMMETDCDELIFAFEVEEGRLASFAYQGEPASFDVEIRDADDALLGSGSFQPDYDQEDDGCGCGGASVTLELNP